MGLGGNVADPVIRNRHPRSLAVHPDWTMSAVAAGRIVERQLNAVLVPVAAAVNRLAC